MSDTIFGCLFSVAIVFLYFYAGILNLPKVTGFLFLSEFVIELVSDPIILYILIFPREYISCIIFLFVNLAFTTTWVRYWYQYEQGDYFINLFSFTLFRLCLNIFCKNDCYPDILYSVFHVVVFTASMWLFQAIIYFQHFGESVVILSSDVSSGGDSGHMKVKAGKKLWQIFKQNGSIKAEIIIEPPDTLTPDRIAQWKWYRYAFLPPFGYGIFGRTQYTDHELQIVFDKIVESMKKKNGSQNIMTENEQRVENENYHSSLRSCQEAAMKFAHKIVTSSKIKIYLTSLKSATIVLVPYLPFLIYLIWANVGVNIRYKYKPE